LKQHNRAFLEEKRNIYTALKNQAGVKSLDHAPFNRIYLEELDPNFGWLRSGESERIVSMILRLYEVMDSTEPTSGETPTYGPARLPELKFPGQW
jgi:hypothetical protein